MGEGNWSSLGKEEKLRLAPLLWVWVRTSFSGELLTSIWLKGHNCRFTAEFQMALDVSLLVKDKVNNESNRIANMC